MLEEIKKLKWGARAPFFIPIKRRAAAHGAGPGCGVIAAAPSDNAPNGAPVKPHHAYRTVSLMQQANFHLYKTCIANIYLDLDS
ncbi:MAG: hypothetical protein ACYCWB_02130 [Thiobacillus sp.]